MIQQINPSSVQPTFYSLPFFPLWLQRFPSQVVVSCPLKMSRILSVKLPYVDFAGRRLFLLLLRTLELPVFPLFSVFIANVKKKLCWQRLISENNQIKDVLLTTLPTCFLYWDSCLLVMVYVRPKGYLDYWIFPI
jgi:hypothetical protein